jgi:hypothetical protein
MKRSAAIRGPDGVWHGHSSDHRMHLENSSQFNRLSVSPHPLAGDRLRIAPATAGNAVSG